MTLQAASCAQQVQTPCQPLTHAEAPFIVCKFDAETDDIRLFLNGADGERYAQFDALSDALADSGERLVFAMNAGMYLPDRRPVGLLIERGETLAPLNLAEGNSNFTLKPNGVFWIDETRAGVEESTTFQASGRTPNFATQSGPMLVIDGALHPAFREDSSSRHRRNGVGVARDGRTVHFAISEVPVNFHTFATLFRDRLETPNALYFDGRISQVLASNLSRSERGADMGPIVGVVETED